MANLITSNEPGQILFGNLTLVIILSTLSITYFRGLGGLLGAFIEIISASLIMGIIFFPNDSIHLILGANLSLLSLAGVISGGGSFAIISSLARVFVLPSIHIFSPPLIAAGILLGSLLGAYERLIAILIAVLSSTLLAALGLHIGKEAANENPKYIILHWLAIRIISKKGTCFHSANLTNVNFDYSVLCNVDFRHSSLSHASWRGAHKISQALLGVVEAKLRYGAISLKALLGESFRADYFSIKLNNPCQMYLHFNEIALFQPFGLL